MAEITLAALAGRPTGSGACNRLRTAGRIPAVVYGHGMEPIAISVEGRDLRSALTTASGLNALLSLDVDGSTHLTLAREIQRHPVRHNVTHVDFQIVRRDEIVSAEVPINLVGEALQVARDLGVVEQPLTALTVQAVPGRIPNSIEVDISDLAIGDTIRVADLPLPEGVTTDVDGDEAVVLAQGSALAAQVAADEELTPAEEAPEAPPAEAPEV